jgi:hypothetical protein
MQQQRALCRPARQWHVPYLRIYRTGDSLGPYVLSQQHAICSHCVNQADKRDLTCHAHLQNHSMHAQVAHHMGLTSTSTSTSFSALASCDFAGSSSQCSSGWVTLNQAAAFQLQRSGCSCAGSDC